MPRKGMIAVLVLAVLAAAGAVALYRFALPGLSSARSVPPKIEMDVATWLLRNSVPAKDAARVNPLKPDEATIAAGPQCFSRNALSIRSCASAVPSRSDCESSGAVSFGGESGYSTCAS